MTVRCSASLRRSLEYLSIHMHNKSLNLKGRVFTGGFVSIWRRTVHLLKHLHLVLFSIVISF
jgi:hypothetical protein